MADDKDMMVIVSDAGFAPDERAEKLLAGRYGEVAMSDLTAGLPDDAPTEIGLLLANDTDASQVQPYFDSVDTIIVAFPSFADGRGFSLATQLRRLGYSGRLIAQGHVIADQYAHARRCGFDAVAIDRKMAERQPQAQWLAQLTRINATYQRRLQQSGQVA